MSVLVLLATALAAPVGASTNYHMFGAAAAAPFHSLDRNAVAMWEATEDGISTYAHVAVGLQSIPWGGGQQPERLATVNVARYESWVDEHGFFHSFGGWGRGEGAVTIDPNLGSATVSADIPWEFCSHDENTGIDSCWPGPMMPITATFTAIGPLERYSQYHEAFGSRWATFVNNSIVLRREATAIASIGGEPISGAPTPEWTELSKSHLNVIMVFPPMPHG